MTATHAIYHLSVRNISRAGGSSACASLAYITGLKIRDEYLAKTHDYSRKERVQAVQTFLPSGTPPAFDDPAYLVNSLETTVTSSTARNAKMIVVALPQGMSLEEQKATVGRFVRENLTDRGFPAVVAWHTDKDGRNPHAHIEVMNRKLNHGKWSKMTKTTYVLDKDGQRVPLIDKKTGRQKVDKRNRKQWKRQTVTANPLNSQETLLAWRKSWETTLNAHLPQQMKVSCQSLEAQGIDRVPTIHEGYAARAIEARGGVSERMETNRQIHAHNGLLAAQKALVARLRGEIDRLKGEIAQLRAEVAKLAQTAQKTVRRVSRSLPHWTTPPSIPVTRRAVGTAEPVQKTTEPGWEKRIRSRAGEMTAEDAIASQASESRTQPGKLHLDRSQLRRLAQELSAQQEAREETSPKREHRQNRGGLSR